MTQQEVKKQITDTFISFEAVKLLYGLEDDKTFDEQFSSVSIENILFYCISVVGWALYQLFELHKKEVNEIIQAMRPGTTYWYASMSKLFQYGHILPTDSDTYNNEGLTDAEIESSRIVAHSAVRESEKTLLIKVAKSAGESLAPLTEDELTAFGEYMQRVKYAGVDLSIISSEPDALRAELNIYYDPLVLSSSGSRLDGTSSTPVKDAINAYLQSLPFNGELTHAHLEDALQEIEGVVLPHIRVLGIRYGGLDWQYVDVSYIPYAGYLALADEDLTVNYIPKRVIK